MIRAINGFTPNGNISNPIAEFWQNTAPARRIDGTLLQNGDLWKKVGQEQTEWEGTQWVGDLKEVAINAPVNLTVTTSNSGISYAFGNTKILLKAFIVIGRVEAVPVDPAADYWSFELRTSNGISVVALSPSVSVNNQNVAYIAQRNLYYLVPLNQVVNFSAAINNTSNPRGFATEFTRFGVAPTLSRVSAFVQYRTIYE